MEQLPIELVTQIFGFLHPVYDRLARFSLVCHQWKEIIQTTTSLWEHIHLTPRQLTEKEKIMVLRYLREYDDFIKCLRVASLDVVFGSDFWFFVHRVTLEMTNLTCIDIPTFPWNLEQFATFKSAEKLKELNIYGFWDLSSTQWIQHFRQPVSLISPGHLQLVKQRCTKLKVLKLSINMLRVPEKALMEFVYALDLKELQISAYNSSEANIPMNRNSVRLLRCLLLSKYTSKVTRLDLRYVSIGHKELRLLLKRLKSLRYLKLCFVDNHRCMIGYQYLDSKSLEYFELDDLPAKNIMRLKCSMPKLRGFILSGCSSLKSLQIVSSRLERLFLNFLANLQSVHVTSLTLKRLEVANCGSLTSKNIEKIFQNNSRIEHCTIRGHLVNHFQLSQMEASGVLTELCLWITDFFKLDQIRVHCPTLKSFMCNYHNTAGKSSITTPECCIDVQCNVLLDAYISVPKINLMDIKCKAIKHLLLNVGEKKCETPCRVVRILAERRLRTFFASKCIFTRVEINAEEINNLNFNSCRISELKLVGNCIDTILMRNVKRFQENIDLIARCKEIRKVILRDCETLRSVTVFPNEKQFYDTSQIEHLQLESLQMPPTASYDIQEGVRHGVEEEEKDSMSGVGDGCAIKEVAKSVAVLNCPRFRGLLTAYKKVSNVKLSPGQQHSTFGSEQNPGTSTDGVEEDNLVSNSNVSQEIFKVTAKSSGVLDHTLTEGDSGSS